jgi:hypothetical protein
MQCGNHIKLLYVLEEGKVFKKKAIFCDFELSAIVDRTWLLLWILVDVF